MVAKDRLDIVHGGVHEIAAVAAMDVDVDEARRDVEAACVDALSVRRHEPRLKLPGVLDAPGAADEHSARHQSRVCNQHSIVKDLRFGHRRSVSFRYTQ